MGQLLNLVSTVTNIWTLVAFALVCIVYMATRRRLRKVPVPLLVVTCALPIAAMAFQMMQSSAPFENSRRAVYHLRVTVLDTHKVPVDNAKVWSSLGGEPKKVEGGWQFDIPAINKPSDGRMTVFAAVSDSFFQGAEQVHLSDNYAPSVTVYLFRQATAAVRGVVTDTSGRAISQAMVSVVGQPAESIKTGSDGNFSLPAHAAEGQQVYLHAEKEGFEATNQWHPAGEAPASLVLKQR